MATSRKDIIDPQAPGIYHCWTRCVRRAFLCGKDRYTKKDYSHRRDWIEQRLQELVRWFAIDVAFFAIMQNHFHLVLRTLPHLAAKWSDRQVIKRSCKIFPYKFKELGVKDGELTREQLRNFVKDRKLVEEMRSRLSDPSWLLRQLKQYIANRSNAEDETTGHFFDGRFKCRAVTDEAGLLICGIYVDLNQIRAEEADSVETSKRTSGYRRRQALKARNRKARRAAEWDGFLCPINAHGDGQVGYPKAGALDSLRASDKGLLEMSVEDYLKLLDWTGRQTRRDKRGKISDDAPPVLDGLGLDGPCLVTLVEHFEKLFHVAVGTASSLATFAAKLGRGWLQGAKAVAQTEGI